MKKVLPTIACALFLTAGIVQAQVVVRIGPPAALTNEFLTRSIGTGLGLPATTAGTATATSGFPERMSNLRASMRAGFQAVGSAGVGAGSGSTGVGANPTIISTRWANVTAHRGIIIQ